MNALQKLARDMRRGFSLMVGRAILSAVRDGGALQLVQAERLADETADDLERFSDYGFTSVPHAGAELVIVSAGGVRSHGLVIACEDRRYRLKGLQTGEVALYDDLGQVVKLGRNGISIESESAVKVAAPEVTITANSVTIDADESTLTGNVSIDGNLTVDGNSELGGAGGRYVKRIDDSPSTRVKA